MSRCLVYLALLYSVYRDENAQLADIFLKKGPYLKMYSTYIREFDKNVALLEEQSKRNPAFGAVVREFEVTSLAWPVFSVREGCMSFGLMRLDHLCVCRRCVHVCVGFFLKMLSFLNCVILCPRPVHAVPTWLWSIIYWSRFRGFLSISCCSQVLLMKRQFYRIKLINVM